MGEIPSQPDFPTNSSSLSDSKLYQSLSQRKTQLQIQGTNQNRAAKNIDQIHKNPPKQTIQPVKRTLSQASQVLNKKVAGSLGNVKSPNVAKWWDTTSKTVAAKTGQFHKEAIKGINNNILKAENYLTNMGKPAVKSQAPKAAIPKGIGTMGKLGKVLGPLGEFKSLYEQGARTGEDIALPLVLGAGGLIPGVRDSKDYQELVEAYSDLRRERREQQGWKRFFQPTENQIIQPAKYLFTGGQSQGVSYVVTVTWKSYLDEYDHSGGYINQSIGPETLTGKITGIGTLNNSSYGVIYNNGASIRVLPGWAGQVHQVNRGNVFDFKITSVVRADGQPDTGGNPAPTQPEISGVTQPPPIPDLSNQVLGVDGSELASELAQILGIIPSMPTQKIAVSPRVPTRYPDTKPNTPEQDELERDSEPDGDGKFFIPDFRTPINPYISDTPIPSKTYTSIGESDKNENHQYIPIPIAVATGKPEGGESQQVTRYTSTGSSSSEDPFGTPITTPIAPSDPNPTKSPTKTPIPTPDPKPTEQDKKFNLPLPLPIVGKADPVKGDPVNNKLTEPQAPNQLPPTKTPPKTGTECPCNEPVLKGQNTMLDKLDALQGGLNNALDAEILRKVNIIDDKVGDKVDGGLGGFLTNKFQKLWKSRVIDRALNLATFAVAVHNAAMLSNNIKDTLLYGIENALQVIGIKDADDVASSFNEAIGDAVENTIKSIIGADNYTNLVETWKKASRIYQAGTNILSTTLSIHQGLTGGLELIGKYNSKIGNALKASGTVMPNYYDWMEEEISLKTGQSAKIQNFMDGLQNVEEVAEDIEGITSEAVSVKDDLEQLKEQREQLDQALEDERTQKQEEEAQENEQSAAHSTTQKDLVKPNS